MMGLRFFIVGGVILMITGGLQLMLRPRRPTEHRWLNRGTVWAGFCMAVGVVAVLLGAGILHLGGR
jgi:hypothetical protein